MKKFKVSMIIVALGIVFTVGVKAQPPRPPSNQGISGNQSPGSPNGAPIDPGTGIFLFLAACYGLKKVYNARRRTVEE